MTLPAHMHEKNGRYYYVRRDPDTKKLKWISLSKNLDEALRQREALVGGVFSAEALAPIAPQHALVQALRKTFAKAKGRSKTKGATYFAITFDDVIGMATRQNWRCAVTGIKFSDGKIEGAHVRPYMASIDRIKSSEGYTPTNTRLVCVAVNLALSTYGEEVFGTLARRYVAKVSVRGTSSRRRSTKLVIGLQAA